jgi:flagellar M-ring protein FliF
MPWRPRAKAWSEAELARVEKLLRVGLGVDAGRGDQIAVSSMPFTAPTPLPAWWQEPGNWYGWVVTALWAAGGLALLVLLARLVNAVLRGAAATKVPQAGEAVALAGAAAGGASCCRRRSASVPPPICPWCRCWRTWICHPRVRKWM